VVRIHFWEQTLLLKTNYMGTDIYNSSDTDNSNYIYNSSDIDSSSYVRFLYKAIFCHDISFKEYVAFNKEVGEQRFEEIYSKVSSIMSPNLQMKDNNFSDEWKKNITKKQWKELSQIPEFDREVVENIVGFTLPLKKNTQEDVKEITQRQTNT